MAYYSIATNDFVSSGTDNFLEFDDLHSPFNYLNLSQNIFYQMESPFSLNFTSYDSSDENPFKITILSPDFSLNSILSKEEFEQTVRNRPLHQHNTYELVYILKGELYQRIENKRHRYLENSCCFINRNVRHAEEYSTCFQTVTLSLSRNFLANILVAGEDNYFEVEKNI